MLRGNVWRPCRLLHVERANAINDRAEPLLELNDTALGTTDLRTQAIFTRNTSYRLVMRLCNFVWVITLIHCKYNMVPCMTFIFVDEAKFHRISRYCSTYQCGCKDSSLIHGNGSHSQTVSCPLLSRWWARPSWVFQWSTLHGPFMVATAVMSLQRDNPRYV